MLGIVGASTHQEVSFVCRALDDLGCDFVLLDRSAQAPFSFGISKNGVTLTGDINGQPLSDISLFWFAGKSTHLLFGSTEEWARDYVTGTAWQALENNVVMAAKVPVINCPEAVSRCRAKLWQLIVARESGFLVPDTCVTNHAPTVEDRILTTGPRIVKMLGDPHVPKIGDTVGQRAVLTNLLPLSLLTGRQSEVETSPMYTQELIDKAFEIRVVVVGTDHFAFHIDPNQHPIMNVDYRRGGQVVNYRPWSLPDDLSKRIAKLHLEFGLFSGCYDFIVNKDDEVIFLEVNPQGIWSYHDTLVDGSISKAFARHLSAALAECS